MKNMDFAISLKSEMNDSINRMQKYYNFLTNKENYDKRLFFLTFANEQVINDMITFFPENYKEIRKCILTETAKYISQNKTLLNYIIDFDDNSDDYNLFIKNKNNETLIEISLIYKKTYLIKDLHILMNEVQISECKNKMEKIKNQMEQIKLLFEEENISDVGEYAKKMFFPKRYFKKLNKDLNILQQQYIDIQNELNHLMNQLNVYKNSNRYQEQKRISESIDDIFSIKR